MGIDNNIEPTISISFRHALLKSLKESANNSGLNDNNEEIKDFYEFDINNLNGYNIDEYYFDEKENHLHIAGNSGDSYFYIEIPITDVVLIDILNYALKKYNKFKTALEALK